VAAVQVLEALEITEDQAEEEKALVVKEIVRMMELMH
jgi:hypothetical protein